MGKGTSVTVGHKYLLGKHEVLCHGPIDSINRIVVDAKTAWAGRATGGAITIDAETLFGGSKSEWVVESTLDTITPPDNSDADGISGTVDILMGEPTQTKNSYLQSVLGELIPAFRGVVSVVLRQCYIGNSEYPKPWQYDATRIHVKENGEAQWYDEKAEIAYSVSTEFPKYLNISAYNNASEFNSGVMKFGGLEVTGAKVTDLLRVTKRSFASGGEYLAWSPWITDIDNPFPWTNRFSIGVKDGAGTWVYTDYFEGLYVTPENAEAAVLNAEIILTGSTEYRVGLFDTPWNDNRGGLSFSVELLAQGGDMNPSHIIRECDTSRIWGLGRPEYEINDASFTAAADQLYAEKMGISLLWDQQKPIEEFIEEIKRHIDAVHYTDDDGLLTLKLIRDDYDIDDLIVLDESNVLRVEHAASTPTTELVNSVTVIYWDPATNKDASVTVSDPALVQMQGRIISTTIHYPGFTNANIATRAAMRDLRTLSNSLYSTQLVVNFSVSDLQKGSPFILNLPEYNAHNMVMRLVDINHGDGINNEIRITCTQDVFALPNQPVMTPSTDQQWVNPNGPATAVAAQLVFELPYYELVQAQGQAAVDSALAEPTTAALGVAAVRPNGASRNAQIMVDSGDGYRAADELDFCPSAVLAGDIGFTETSITFENEVDLDLLVKGQHAQIDDELVVITAMDFAARTATIGRGVLDTVPALHTAGTRIWFWDTYFASDSTTYTEGETLQVKVLPNSSSGRLALAAATAGSVEFIGRAARPYPPGKLLINGTAYPATIGATEGLGLAWAHRDRLLQTAGTLQDTTVSDIGPEPGTTYSLRIYGDADVLLRDIPGITDNFYNYTTVMEGEDLDSGTVSVDEFWPKVSLLLNMNGANASTTFVDSSPNFAAVFGNAQISTAQFKYGAASGFFDGTGDYLSFSDSENFNFGTGNVTVEAWIYPTTTATAREIIAQRSTADNSNFWFLRVTSAAKIQLTAVSGGSTITSITSNGTIAVNTWSHVAAVRSAGTWKIWINGVNSDSVSTNSTSSWPNVGYPLLVGAGDETSNYFNGYIDDLRITKGAARYTATFAPPNKLGNLITPLNFNDYGALINFELLTSTEVNSTVLQTGDYAKNYADIPPYWSSTAYGEAGDYADTTVDVTDSKFGTRCGNGIFLYSRDEFAISVADSPVVGSMTWDAWVKIPSSFSSTGYVYEIFSYPGLWKLGIQALGAHWFEVEGGIGGGSVYHPVILEATTVDVWVHYAVTMTQSVIVPAPSSGSPYETVCKLYRNGVLFLTTTAQVPAASAARAYDFKTNAIFKIDELRIRRGLHYTANFTPETAASVIADPYWANTVLLMPFENTYGATAFENIAEITKTLTASGNTQISTAQFKYGGAAGLFDGSGDYLSATHNILHSIQGGNFTIEAWVYRNVSGALHYILSKRPSGTTSTGWEWRINATDFLQFFHVGGSSLISTGTVPSGQWVHVATVRNGATVTHYINGVASGSGTFTNGTENTSDTLKVGIASDLSGSFNGYIDDVRITNGAARYTAPFEPPALQLAKYITVPGELSGTLTFELESERDGLVSWQKHRHTVTRAI